MTRRNRSLRKCVDSAPPALSGKLTRSAATAADGKLHVGGESFSIVVLPPLTTIPFAALQCLRDFAEGGGKLVALGQLPVHSSEQRDDPRMAAVLAELRKQGRLTFAETPASMSETEWLNLLRFCHITTVPTTGFAGRRLDQSPRLAR